MGNYFQYFCIKRVATLSVFACALLSTMTSYGQPSHIEQGTHKWCFDAKISMHVTNSKSDEWAITNGSKDLKKAIKIEVPISVNDILISDSNSDFYFPIDWTGNHPKLGDIGIHFDMHGVVDADNGMVTLKSDGFARLLIKQKWRMLDASKLLVRGHIERSLSADHKGRTVEDCQIKGSDEVENKQAAHGQLIKEPSRLLRSNGPIPSDAPSMKEQEQSSACCSSMKHFFLKFKISFMGASIEIETWTFTRNPQTPTTPKDEEGTYENTFIDQFLENKGVTAPERRNAIVEVPNEELFTAKEVEKNEDVKGTNIDSDNTNAEKDVTTADLDENADIESDRMSQLSDISFQCSEDKLDDDLDNDDND